MENNIDTDLNYACPIREIHAAILVVNGSIDHNSIVASSSCLGIKCMIYNQIKKECGLNR